MECPSMGLSLQIFPMAAPTHHLNYIAKLGYFSLGNSFSQLVSLKAPRFKNIAFNFPIGFILLKKYLGPEKNLASSNNLKGAK